MKVSELIQFLQTQPQHLEVIYRCYSEYALLKTGDIEVGEACPVRDDDWVAHQRPDKPTQTYLIFPGN